MASGPSLSRAELRRAASTRNEPCHVTTLERQRPQPWTQAGTTASTWDPNWAEPDRAWGGFGRSSSGQVQLPSVSWATWHTVVARNHLPAAWFPSDFRIFIKGLAALGMVHGAPQHRQQALPTSLYAEAHRQINPMKLICLVLLYFKQEERHKER